MVLRLGIKAFRNEVVVVPRLKLARPRATVVFCLWIVESPMEVVVTPLKMEEFPMETVVFPLAMEVLPTATAVLPSVMLVLPIRTVAVSPELVPERLLLTYKLHGCLWVRSQTKATVPGALNRSGHCVWTGWRVGVRGTIIGSFFDGRSLRETRPKGTWRDSVLKHCRDRGIIVVFS